MKIFGLLVFAATYSAVFSLSTRNNNSNSPINAGQSITCVSARADLVGTMHEFSRALETVKLHIPNPTKTARIEALYKAVFEPVTATYPAIISETTTPEQKNLMFTIFKRDGTLDHHLRGLTDLAESLRHRSLLAYTSIHFFQDGKRMVFGCNLFTTEQQRSEIWGIAD